MGVRSFGIVILVLLMLGVPVWVAILNWCRPEALLYGADIHFEKWKTEYGTEQGGAARTDLQQAAANPQNGVS